MKLYEVNLLCQDQDCFSRLNQSISRLTKIQKQQIWGEKKLAYPIKKQGMGFLASLWIKADAKILTQLKENLKQENNLLRQLILSKLNWQMEDLSAAQKLEHRAKSSASQKITPPPTVKKSPEDKKTLSQPESKLVKPQKEKKEKIKPEKTSPTSAVKEKAEKAPKKEKDDSDQRLKALDKKLKEILADDK